MNKKTSETNGNKYKHKQGGIRYDGSSINRQNNTEHTKHGRD